MSQYRGNAANGRRERQKDLRVSSWLRVFVAPALLLTACGCGPDEHVTFARLLERAASWGSSIELAQELAQGGLVPPRYVADLMATASQELTTLTTQIDDSDGVDAGMKRKAAASCSGLAALAGDAARMHGTPTQSSIRELEVELRASAQQARGVDDAR